MFRPEFGGWKPPLRSNLYLPGFRWTLAGAGDSQ